MNFGSLFLVIYVGKHPGCTQAELTKALRLDWGYSQRSVTKLVDAGFLTREKAGRAYHLNLSVKGQEAFSVSHQVFFDWDRQALSALDAVSYTNLNANEIPRSLDLPQSIDASADRNHVTYDTMHFIGD